jgi:hypothetical protein
VGDSLGCREHKVYPCAVLSVHSHLAQSALPQLHFPDPSCRPSTLPLYPAEPVPDWSMLLDRVKRAQGVVGAERAVPMVVGELVELSAPCRPLPRPFPSPCPYPLVRVGAVEVP